MKVERYYCGNGDGMFGSEKGEYVAYSDYTALQQEVERLSAINQSLQKDYEAECHLNACVSEEVERLRELVRDIEGALSLTTYTEYSRIEIAKAVIESEVARQLLQTKEEKAHE